MKLINACTPSPTAVLCHVKYVVFEAPPLFTGVEKVAWSSDGIRRQEVRGGFIDSLRSNESYVRRTENTSLCYHTLFDHNQVLAVFGCVIL